MAPRFRIASALERHRRLVKGVAAVVVVAAVAVRRS
jgi:hypothetical protein